MKHTTLFALLFSVVLLSGLTFFSVPFLLSQNSSQNDSTIADPVDDGNGGLVANIPQQKSSPLTQGDATSFVQSDILRVDLAQEGSRSVPFGNGKGLGVVENAVLGLYTDDGAVYASRFVDESVESSVLLSAGSVGFSSAASLSTLGNQALALLVGAQGIQATWSTDGGATWSGLETVGDRSNGAQVPTSCVWYENSALHAMIAWVDPLEVGQGGPLYVRTYDGTAWGDVVRVGTQDVASSPSLVCTDTLRTMVYREGAKNNINIFFTTETNGVFEPAVRIFEGADVHMAMCHDTLYLGYHHQGAMLGISRDFGQTWSTQQLDPTGKFGSIACAEDTVVISWGHFPSLAIANNAISSDNQRSAYATVSFDAGETWSAWRPAGEAVDQNVSTVAASADTAYMLWETSGAVQFASLRK